MPSTQKTLLFLSSALATAISVGILGFAMSRLWITSTMECGSTASDLYNGSAVIQMGLFNATLIRSYCPSFGGTDVFEVFSKLVETGTTEVVLHGLSVCLLALCLLFSVLSILIALYNSVSNPYETYMGPSGIYACSSLCACLSLVVLIIFAVNLSVIINDKKLISKIATVEVEVRNKSSEMMVGYFLLIPYMVLSLGAVLLIYMYDHAAYTHRREQERPTEDAPKEIMMY